MDKLTVSTGDVLECYVSDDGTFGECVAQLGGVRPSIDVFSANKVAQVRILSGKDSVFSKKGCWVGENFNYNGCEIVIAPRVIGVGKYNPIFAFPVEATNAHLDGKEFYFDNKIWSELRVMAEKDPEKAIKNGVPLLLSRKGLSEEIPVSALADDVQTIYLFKDFAKQYGEFLQANGVNGVSRYVVNENYAKKQGKPFGRALWVGSLIIRSMVDCSGDLGFNYGRVFGGRSAKISPLETKVTEKLPVVKTLPNGVVEVDGVKYSRLPEQYQ